MCGINAQFGSLKFHFGNSLIHRGPDEQNTLRSTNFEVEYSRLSITGEAEGRSPVYSRDRRWVCFLNGEIYNFRKLQLVSALPFTNSDTQVIADGISKFGIDFLKNLRGMFAGIAIDLENQDYFVFRDPLGEKPLFFTSDKSGVYLSSEFTALRKQLPNGLKINTAAVADYFRFGYNDELSSFDQRIFSFPPGVVQRIRTEDFKFENIMKLDGFNVGETSLGLAELVETILDETLNTQVPTGLALSSGVDSNSLLYAKFLRDNFDFTPIVVELPESPDRSEASEAIRACEILGLKPLIVSKSADSIADELISLARANDQPHADFSGISYMRIFGAAKQNGLKVVVLGHGPDEFFWGYPWNFPKQNWLGRGLGKFSGRYGNSDPDFWKTPAMARKLTHNFQIQNNSIRFFGSSDKYLLSSNPWQYARGHQVRSYLTGNGLRQTDRLSMHNSIEARTPYADSRLYGWVQENCQDSKSNLPDKQLFRQTVELGPLEFTRNKRKMGFRSDYDSWFSRAEVVELLSTAAKKIDDLGLPQKKGISELSLSASEKYRVLMFGLWLEASL